MINTPHHPQIDSASDGELLEAFVATNDEGAFNELVRRHAGLVMGVCRRALGAHDAEDAFQATFLVLARDARRIRKRQSVASWLYGTAWRIARRAGRTLHVRREQQLREQPMVAEDTLADVARRHEQQLVDEELNRLPEKYRTTVILHDLVGKSCADIAEETGQTVGVIEGRLKRGRRQLRVLLVRRGVTLGVAFALLNDVARAAPVSGGLVESTVRSGLTWAAGAKPTGVCSQTAIQLAGKELIAMTIVKPAITAVGLLLVGTLGLGMLGPGMLGPGHEGGQGGAVLADGAIETTARHQTLAMSPAVITSRGEGPARADIAREANEEQAVPGITDLHPVRQSRIQQTLDGPGEDMQFDEATLGEVVDFIHEAHGLNIVVDRRALEDIGMHPDDVFVTMNLSGVKLRSALRLMLDPHELTFVESNEVLLLTTMEEADTKLETRVYALDWGDAVDSQELVNLVESIPTVVAPETWTEQGGNGAITPGLRGAGRGATLMIRQTQAVHEQIHALLLQLQKASVQMPSTRVRKVERERDGMLEDLAVLRDQQQARAADLMERIQQLETIAVELESRLVAAEDRRAEAEARAAEAQARLQTLEEVLRRSKQDATEAGLDRPPVNSGRAGQ